MPTQYCPKCNKDRDILSRFSLQADSINLSLSCRHLVVLKIEKDQEAKEIHKEVTTPIYNQVANELTLSQEITNGIYGSIDKVTEETLEKELALDKTITVTIPKKPNYKISSIDGKNSLFHFQETGVEFLDNAPNHRALIADEMGLGKTIQALAWMKLHPEAGPFLIIVKSSLRVQWFAQLVRWCGRDYTAQIITNGKDVLLEGFPVYIVAFDLLRRFVSEVEEEVIIRGSRIVRKSNKSQFHSFPFKTVIIDECQAIKNHESSRAREVLAITKQESVKHVIALSGTPIKNNAGEYYTILHILRPDLFPNYQQFMHRWVDSVFTGYGYKVGGFMDYERFHNTTKDFIIRRTREEALPDLPQVTRAFHKVDFDSAELKKKYEKTQKEFIKLFEASENKAASQAELMGLIATMRHLSGVAAIPATLEWITEFILSTERKLIVGVHHEDVHDTLYHVLKKELGIEIVHYHSGLNANQRAQAVQQFVKGDARIFLASTLAAGEGVDGLQEVASDLLLVERQWNPSNEEQFEGRLIRFGQASNKIMATYLMVVNTIAEWFTELVEQKRAILAAALDNKEIHWEESSLMKDLMETIAAKGRRSVIKW